MIEAGADDYVIKPIQPEVLMARIELLLHRVEHQRQQRPPTSEALAEIRANNGIALPYKRQQSEIQLEEISNALSHAVEGISRLDPQGRYLFVNDAYARMVGFAPADLVGTNWQNTVHPDDIALAIATYEQMLIHGKVELEVKGLRRDGSIFDKSLVMVPTYDRQERFTGHYCFMKDISDRKQRSRQLRQQLKRERLIRAITNSIRQTFDLDAILSAAVEQVRQFLQTDRVIVFRFESNWQGIVEAESVAPQWVETLGMKIKDNCFGELYVERYCQGRISSISDLQSAGVDPCHRRLLENFQVRANLVVPILQGEHLWGLLIAHHCSATRQWEPASNLLLQQVATQMGIAIQQAELYRKTREQAALIDIATDAIFVRDLEGRIAFWSRGSERLYGWQKEEAIGQVSHQLLRKDSVEVEKAMRATIQQGFWQGELSQSTKAGDKILVASRWTLVRDQSGQPKSLLEVNTDITEKKRLEAQFYQAQRLESLGQLAGGIAHDLGNVLTPILGIAQLLRITQKNADDATKEQLDILERSAKRGANMVKQILTFAQGSTDDKTTVDITALLQEVIDFARQSFPGSIEIRQNILDNNRPDSFFSVVSADSTHLHQVFMNLCINARDAMPHGGVLTLSIDNMFVDQALASHEIDVSVGHYVVVTVADTGMGISPEVRDRIFEPFFTTKAPGKGTGLGLATVLGIVKNAGGFLKVISEVGKGTQISVYFPAVE
ncbi:MAG: PAS domain S-box protein [Phormidesmis sp. RL_2_1]|nr:PAS domain S-box protein [Phormidesmis sp. RL_2_1]